MKLDVVVAALMVEQVYKLILINNESLIELKRVYRMNVTQTETTEDAYISAET